MWHLNSGELPDGDLQGVATVEWFSEDYFIYRPDIDPKKALSFQPSFWSGTKKRITPRLMFTDGGSIPRFFWNIPGCLLGGSVPPMSFTIIYLRSTVAAGMIPTSRR
jgi:hypothetical protein